MSNPALQTNLDWWVNKTTTTRHSSVCSSPCLLQAGNTLLQTADLGFLFVQDQDKTGVQLRLQRFFATSITLQSALNRTHKNLDVTLCHRPLIL